MFKTEKVVAGLKRSYLNVSQKLGAIKVAPSAAQIQVALFVFGVCLLAAGISTGAVAQDVLDDHTTNYNDIRIAEAIAAILTYLEGSFGALIMIVAGIGAILSSAFGQYKAALGCLVIAVGAFILRSFMSTFFNVDSLEDVS